MIGGVSLPSVEVRPARPRRSKGLRIAALIPLALALATATPARGQLPDIFAMTTDPADREVMTEAAAAV